MTDEQINKMIAEACGWKEITNCTCGGQKRGCPPGAHSWSHTPNYCTDLNAMHEAEKVLEHLQPTSMRHWLEALCKKRKLGNFWQAPARERAEAFVRTMDKWEPTTEESSAVQSTSSGGSGGASTYGGNGLGIAGAAWPPETRITVNGKTFCLADIDKEMTE